MLSDEIAERVKLLSMALHEDHAEWSKFKTPTWESCPKISCQSDRELYERYLSTFDTVYWCGIGRHYKDTPQHESCHG